MHTAKRQAFVDTVSICSLKGFSMERPRNNTAVQSLKRHKYFSAGLQNRKMEDKESTSAHLPMPPSASL